jgi:hypothetical protein
VANYSAKIDVIIAGLRQVNLLEDRLEKINNIISTLNKTRVALNVGGRGQERDLSGKLSKEVNDYVREWVNGNKNIGKSIADVSQQVQQFSQLLDETAMAGSDPKQAGAIRNLATAWADTTKAADRYGKKLNDIQRQALGLQTQAVRDEEVYRRLNAIQSAGFKKKQKQQQEEQAVQKKQAGNQRAESIALGVGFPLMFGAGPGSVAGSLAGSFVGSGFGGQILGGALGQTLDDAAKSAADFARSMREGGDAAGYLTEKLGYLNPETKALIQNAQQSGQTAVAAALAQKELANAIGGSAAADLKNYGELWDFTGRQFQKFTLLLQAGMPQIIAQTVAAATGLTGLYAVVSKLPVVAGLAGMVAPKEKPETVEAQTKTKELKEQLAVAKANYQVSLQNNTANSQGYLISKAQTIQTEKTVKYNEIIRDLEIKKISEKDKITKILALELNTTQQLRDLDKERVQILDQRNQVVLAQQQATQQVSLIQQQVQLAREQNTASEVRKTALQGQISIQQALNAQESISLQLNQELNKQQRDRNENKIKELQAQRSVATANIELAQQQAAQQQQQSQTAMAVEMLTVTKTRLALMLEFIDLGYKQAAIEYGELQTLKSRYDALDKEAAIRKNILDLERKIEIQQRPAAEVQINQIYALRFAVLAKSEALEKKVTEYKTKQVAAEQQISKYKIKREGETAVQATQRQVTKAQIGVQAFGMGEGQTAALELENQQQERRIDLLNAYNDKRKELQAAVYAATPGNLAVAQLALDVENQTYVSRSLLLNQLDALEKKQLVLNEITRQYGPIIQGVGDAIGTAMTKGVQGLIEGTTTAQQVFADFLKTVGDILMQEGAKMIATYMAIAAAQALANLFSPVKGAIGGGDAFGAAASSSTFNAGTSTAFGGMSIPGFAAGGNPPVGKASLVGEKGPELFVPRTSGTIVPADATAAAMARYQRQGGSSSGNSSSNAMGADAVATPVLSMSFETTRFLGQDYVSTDQLQAAMMATEKRAAAAGAKAGAAQVTSKLQQSPAYRRQVGLR